MDIFPPSNISRYEIQKKIWNVKKKWNKTGGRCTRPGHRRYCYSHRPKPKGVGLRPKKEMPRSPHEKKKIPKKSRYSGEEVRREKEGGGDKTKGWRGEGRAGGLYSLPRRTHTLRPLVQLVSDRRRGRIVCTRQKTLLCVCVLFFLHEKLPPSFSQFLSKQ